MKNTVLSKKDAKIIEKIILKVGNIASTEDLIRIFSAEYSRASAQNRIQILAQSGWFLRIKKGFYMIVSDISSRSTGDVSLLAVSQSLNKDSYISLHSALNYHGMFDQYSKNVIAVNLKMSKSYKFQGNDFRFVRVAKKYYFGFTQNRVDGKKINIAEKEKALLDYLHLDHGFYAASLVFEKLSSHKRDIDFRKLQIYASKFGVSVQRKVGFLLDQLNINTDQLLKNSKLRVGSSRFTKGSKRFNAKWRLYYDDRIIK